MMCASVFVIFTLIQIIPNVPGVSTSPATLSHAATTSPQSAEPYTTTTIAASIDHEVPGAGNGEPTNSENGVAEHVASNSHQNNGEELMETTTHVDDIITSTTTQQSSGTTTLAGSDSNISAGSGAVASESHIVTAKTSTIVVVNNISTKTSTVSGVNSGITKTSTVSDASNDVTTKPSTLSHGDAEVTAISSTSNVIGESNDATTKASDISDANTDGTPKSSTVNAAQNEVTTTPNAISGVNTDVTTQTSVVSTVTETSAASNEHTPAKTSTVPHVDDPEYTSTTAMPVDRIVYDTIRLPQTVKPSIYEIILKPFIYINTVEPFVYECKTIINVTCLEDTDVIKLHSVQHEILVVRVIDVTENIDVGVAYFSLNTPTGMLGILIKTPLSAGKQYTLIIESTGQITDGLQGFYRSPYKVGDQTRYIVTTMMEPTDARMVFPCFDEPDFKAVFLFYIYRKEGLTCLTNLPKRETIGPDEDGFYLDIFDQPRNVPMSTYLVAIAIGDLSYKEASVRDIKFRTWSRPNAVHLTDFSLEIGVKTTEFFEDYFKIKYPLPKQDMIAVPTMSFNAMEHWGLITCREESMLYELNVSSASDKEWTAILVAHEISHQWFGNIVSPKWWDELWLNEGFATYMMMLAVDNVMPEWETMVKMPVDYRGTQSVFNVDDTLTSHPVYVPVEHPREIGEIFDLISYAKGSAVIRMMNFILGDDTFRNGLTRFLDAYSYDTATHVDLWNSLSQQAVADNSTHTDVKGIMDTWIKEKNYPVVMVTRKGPSVCLDQSAFLLSEEERQNRSHVFWDIPFTYTTDAELAFDKKARDIVWLKKDGTTVCFEDETINNVQWIIGNIKQYGYFRVNYDIDNWRAILRQLSENHELIHPNNRAQIINDAWHLASAGLLDFEIALGTFNYLDEEVHFVPWKAAIANLNYIKKSIQLHPIYGEFQKFMSKKITKAYLNSAGARTHNEKITYAMLGYAACGFGLEACVKDASDLFNQWMNDGNYVVNPDMKSTVYCMGVKYGGADAWEYVLERYLQSDSSAERRFLVEALACTEEPWILSKLTEIVIHSPGHYFLSTDKIMAMSQMAKTPVGRLMAWNVVEENWDLLFEKYGTELNLFPSLIKGITKPFNLPFELRRLERLAEEKQTKSKTGPRLFSSAISRVKSNIRWINAHYDELEKWVGH